MIIARRNPNRGNQAKDAGRLRRSGGGGGPTTRLHCFVPAEPSPPAKVTWLWRAAHHCISDSAAVVVALENFVGEGR